ncbi:MAG: sugar ABC transporter permease [Candidatus Vecturithrix sp.]|jgi:sn-glycerol 3-phosphate transport system permease protein|nr:sugar ABC transporter permease [Candidatus Vecturithrix sp.]
MQTKFPEKWIAYLLLAPSVLIVIIFLIVPSVQSIHLSFYRISPFGDRQIFKGLENFATLFRSADYRNSLKVTIIFTLSVVIVGIFLSLLLAIAANQKIKGIGFYRTALIWPYALSPAVAGVIWAMLFDPATGAASFVMKELTGLTPSWRTNGTVAIILIIAAATWKMIGYNVIFFLSGLQGIQYDIIEASHIDGAGPLNRFWHITVPLISPMTFFLFIMNSLYAFFEVFGLIDIMTQGGPARATEVLVYSLYLDGFRNLRTGYAAAQSIILFTFVAALTLLQFRFSKKWVFYQ